MKKTVDNAATVRVKMTVWKQVKKEESIMEKMLFVWKTKCGNVTIKIK